LEFRGNFGEDKEQKEIVDGLRAEKDIKPSNLLEEFKRLKSKSSKHASEQDHMSESNTTECSAQSNYEDSTSQYSAYQ